MTAFELLGIAQASQGPAVARLVAAAGGRLVVAPAGDLLGLAHRFAPLGPSARDVDFGRQIAAFYAAVQCVGAHVAFAAAAPGTVFEDLRGLTRALVANADGVRPTVALLSAWREFNVEVACPPEAVLARAIDDPAFNAARQARVRGDRAGFLAAVEAGLNSVRVRWAEEARRHLEAVAIEIAPAARRGPHVLLCAAVAVAARDVDVFDLAVAEIDALAPDAIEIQVAGPSVATSFGLISFESAEPARVRAACAAIGVSTDDETEKVAAAVREHPGVAPGVRALAERAARARSSLMAAGERRPEDALWLAQVRGAGPTWGRAA